MTGGGRRTFTDCEVWWQDVTAERLLMVKCDDWMWQLNVYWWWSVMTGCDSWTFTDGEVWWLEETAERLLMVKCDDWRYGCHTNGNTRVLWQCKCNASASVSCQVLELETKCFSVRSTAPQGTKNFIQSDANCFSVTPRASACETKSFSLKPTASEWDQEFQSVINYFKKFTD